MEIWKDIPSWEGLYQASNAGRIKSLDRVVPGRHKAMRYKGRILTVGGKNYPTVSLSRAERRLCESVHRLIARTFLGPCPAGKEVCHGDGNKWNCALRNLRYDTPMANHQDRILHGVKRKPRRVFEHCPTCGQKIRS